MALNNLQVLWNGFRVGENKLVNMLEVLFCQLKLIYT